MTTRIFLTDIKITASVVGTRCTLPVRESHYIANVLRLTVGDTLELGDVTTGTISVARLVSLAEEVTVEFQRILHEEANAQDPLTILVALCKGQKNNQICDWATELSCTDIIFWQSTRSVMRLKDQKECLHRQTRLEKIALAAAQQSKQLKPPTVRVVPSLNDAINASSAIQNNYLKLLCSLSIEARPIAETLRGASGHRGTVLVIGPEGGLTEQEEQLLESHGFNKVALSTRVLRSELAVVTALAAITLKTAVAGL